MASAVASTSTYVFPPFSRACSPLPTLRVDASDDDDAFRIKYEDTAAIHHGAKTIVLSDNDARLPEQTSGGRKKKYLCAWPGCGKAYTRPVRLEEHQRSHTGERPLACSECEATFARDTHLKAHMRTHASEADKPFTCTEDDCDKRFWTNQHLRAHVDSVHRGNGKTYNCPDCTKTFRKHRLLKEHLAVEHEQADFKPLVCSHPGCGKAFKQKHHLKGHEKVHDLTRYACLHPDCASKPFAERQFGVWSALQKHTKAAHPPQCHYPECAGKTFTTSTGLRAHLKLHGRAEGVAHAESAERRGRKRGRTRGRGRMRAKGKSRAEETSAEEEEAVMTASGDEEADEEDYEEEGSDWEERQEAERDERMREDFRQGGKKKRKVLHEAHGFPPLPPSTGSFAGSPIVKSEPDDLPFPFAPASPNAPAVKAVAYPVSNFYLERITGANYAGGAPAPPPPSSARKLRTRPSSPVDTRSPASTSKGDERARPGLTYLPRQYACPFPAILALPFEDVKVIAPEDEDAVEDDEGTCQYWFKRVYDVERHLRSRHGVVMQGGRETLETWFEALRDEGGADEEA
ncbi:hypothetical protein JCM10450v2_005573 [Rhodotorula kratochvilovae]